MGNRERTREPVVALELHLHRRAVVLDDTSAEEDMDAEPADPDWRQHEAGRCDRPALRRTVRGGGDGGGHQSAGVRNRGEQRLERRGVAGAGRFDTRHHAVGEGGAAGAAVVGQFQRQPRCEVPREAASDCIAWLAVGTGTTHHAVKRRDAGERHAEIGGKRSAHLFEEQDAVAIHPRRHGAARVATRGGKRRSDSKRVDAGAGGRAGAEQVAEATPVHLERPLSVPPWRRVGRRGWRLGGRRLRRAPLDQVRAGGHRRRVRQDQCRRALPEGARNSHEMHDRRKCDGTRCQRLIHTPSDIEQANVTKRDTTRHRALRVGVSRWPSAATRSANSSTRPATLARLSGRPSAR